jgi:hypothetical protein
MRAKGLGNIGVILPLSNQREDCALSAIDKEADEPYLMEITELR